MYILILSSFIGHSCAVLDKMAQNVFFFLHRRQHLNFFVPGKKVLIERKRERHENPTEGKIIGSEASTQG